MCDLWYGFSIAKTYYRKCLEPVCKENDISPVDLDVLMFLNDNPHCDTATAVAEHMSLAKPNVSIALRHLNERRLIVGIPSDSDRRMIHLKLLDAGRPILKQATDARDAFFKAIFCGFASEELDTFRRAFHQIIANIQHAASLGVPDTETEV